MASKSIPEDRSRAALLLVDIQPDFMPGGALAVAGGDAILDPVRKLMESRAFAVMAATQDWHPRGHISFAGSHAGRKPFETIELYGHPQVLWPDHCVRGTPGAALHPALPWEHVEVVVRKGCDPACDSYSGFRNNWNPRGERPPTGLAGYLRERGIAEVFICGLARDYCCRWSAEDAADAGFRVSFLWDLTRPVEPASDDDVRAALAAHGVRIVRGADISG